MGRQGALPAAQEVEGGGAHVGGGLEDGGAWVGGTMGAAASVGSHHRGWRRSSGRCGRGRQRMARRRGWWCVVAASGDWEGMDLGFATLYICKQVLGFGLDIHGARVCIVSDNVLYIGDVF